MQNYSVLGDYSGFVHFSYEDPARFPNRTLCVNLALPQPGRCGLMKINLLIR